jgi:hypothetical protein
MGEARPYEERFSDPDLDEAEKELHAILDRLDEQHKFSIREIYEWVQDTFVAWHPSGECRERSEARDE